MKNNRTKTISGRKLFYYHDIINYIKNHNKNITKTKTETNTIYQKVIQEGSKQHTIAGEIQWKKNYQILILKKYRRTLSNHIDNPLPKTFIADYYITQQKRTTTCPNAQKTTTQTVTTADSQKTT